ncbi:serine hydrolase [Variovorax sp. J2P1-59]|uniref:serine hydrolase domain-containing protein n=1 Tax=Variovorax flavidus TaxID=3053501 RepID=UPI0025750D6E|nr:serine hydrolase [Variovorax sp. J2P1-59]MDM0077514.1 serine hydrolase [Variovorax sp. J2P1-59]
MKRLRWPLLAALVCVGLWYCVWLRPDLALRVAIGVAAHDICSETFVSGLDPQQTFIESLAPRPGFRLVAPLLRYSVDRERGEVRATIAGVFESRAVHAGATGCMLVEDRDVRLLASGSIPAAAPALSEGAVIAARSPVLQAALAEAFVENDPRAARHTKAVVVMHKGRVIGERYAPGYGPDTPLLGFSMSKSVTNALVGVLVQQGRLDVGATPAWAVEERDGVTLEQLMRMTSGLDLDEVGSGFDPSNRMLYVHGEDMAAFARRARVLAPPGQRWFYSSASTQLAAREVRDAVGGNAEAVQRFVHEGLFGLVGMRHATMEMDVSGTPIGGHYVLASARDWARFGELFRRDGVTATGRRLLPEGWVDWSTTPTLGTSYGAGWWINRGAGPGRRPMPDVPADAFYALGNLGQYVVVVPSEQLVVVRLGRAHTGRYDIAGTNRLVGAAIDSLRK